LDGIPPGCLAISARENSITYFVYVEGHVTKIKYKDIGPNYDNAVTMFVPNAIWTITLGIKSGVYSPAGAWWHFTVDQPNGLVKDVKAYQNFFPNVALHTNSICFGEAFTPDRRSSNPSEVVSAVVDSIEHSYFNRHWTDGKYNNTLKIKVNEFVNKEAMEKGKARIEAIGKELLAIETSDWGSLTDKKITDLNTKRDKLAAERKTLVDKSKTTREDWLESLFPFLAYWTESNRDLIKKDTTTASKMLLVDTFGYSPTGIRNGGDRG
jgi:hypothetical protein